MQSHDLTIYTESNVHEGYWLNELGSLGIHVKRKNELNDSYELSNLADMMRQTMFQDYKTAYCFNGDRGS